MGDQGDAAPSVGSEWEGPARAREVVAHRIVLRPSQPIETVATVGTHVAPGMPQAVA
jgi:hypothetical protein